MKCSEIEDAIIEFSSQLAASSFTAEQVVNAFTRMYAALSAAPVSHVWTLTNEDGFELIIGA